MLPANLALLVRGSSGAEMEPAVFMFMPRELGGRGSYHPPECHIYFQATFQGVESSQIPFRFRATLAVASYELLHSSCGFLRSSPQAARVTVLKSLPTRPCERMTSFQGGP